MTDVQKELSNKTHNATKMLEICLECYNKSLKLKRNLIPTEKVIQRTDKEVPFQLTVFSN